MKILKLLLFALLALPFVVSAAPISVIVTFSNARAPGGVPPAPRFAFTSLVNSVYANTGSTGVPRLGRADLVTLSWYEGVGTSVSSSYGSNWNGLVTHIQNQGNGQGSTVVIQYYLPDSDAGTTGSIPSPQWKSIVDVNNWWLYNLGTSGTKTNNYFTGGCCIVNGTTNVPTSGGLSMEDTFARFIYKYSILGTQGGPQQAADKAPTLNGFNHDNTVLGVITPADYLRTGLGTQSFGGSADASYRAGLALGFTWLKTNAPGILRLGNISEWGCTVCSQGGTTLGPLDTLLNGGVVENLIGSASYAVESFSDFAHAKAQYQFDMAHTAVNAVTGGRYVSPILYWDSNGRDYVTNNVSPYTSNPNWQAARYELSFGLQDDGVPQISDLTNNTDSSKVTWLDELTVNPSTFAATGEASSTSGKGYMGQAIDPAWTQLPNSVYARRYQNSLGQIWVAMVNPKGNGSQTVTPSQFPGGFGHFQLINGSQAPTVNSGASVTSIALTDRDGRIAKLAP